MPLFVQLVDDAGEPLWHTVESFENVGGGMSSQDFRRAYHAGCGLVAEAGADRMIESAVPPWTNRHVSKGCFKTARDKQKG